MMQGCARLVPIQHPDLGVPLVIDLLLGLQERVQVAGYSVVAHGLEQSESPRQVIDLQTALD